MGEIGAAPIPLQAVIFLQQLTSQRALLRGVSEPDSLGGRGVLPPAWHGFWVGGSP